jgi:hypothetical protein
MIGNIAGMITQWSFRGKDIRRFFSVHKTLLANPRAPLTAAHDPS